MGWNDKTMSAGYDNEDVERCKYGKRYDFKTGEAIDECKECQKENG